MVNEQSGQAQQKFFSQEEPRPSRNFFTGREFTLKEEKVCHTELNQVSKAHRGKECRRRFYHQNDLCLAHSLGQCLSPSGGKGYQKVYKRAVSQWWSEIMGFKKAAALGNRNCWRGGTWAGRAWVRPGTGCFCASTREQLYLLKGL